LSLLIALLDLYGPQGPTLLSNGPTTIEVQGRWITDVIKYCERNGVNYINPTQEAQAEWKKKINHLSDISLVRQLLVLSEHDCSSETMLTYSFCSSQRSKVPIWAAASPTKRSSRRIMLEDCTTMARRSGLSCQGLKGSMLSKLLLEESCVDQIARLLMYLCWAGLFLLACSLLDLESSVDQPRKRFKILLRPCLPIANDSSASP
jgi:hypothetical protein